MAKYKGYLLKVKDQIFPMKYIKSETYTSTDNQRSELTEIQIIILLDRLLLISKQRLNLKHHHFCKVNMKKYDNC